MKEYYMEYEEEITFNDIPRVMANILRKCDLLERSIDVLREEIRQTNKPTTSQHIPMDVKEACDFLKSRNPPCTCTSKTVRFLSTRKARNTLSSKMILLNGLSQDA